MATSSGNSGLTEEQLIGIVDFYKGFRETSSAISIITLKSVASKPVKFTHDRYEDYAHVSTCGSPNCRGECYTPITGVFESNPPLATEEKERSQQEKKKKARKPGVNKNYHPSLKKGGREWH